MEWETENILHGQIWKKMGYRYHLNSRYLKMPKLFAIHALDLERHTQPFQSGISKVSTHQDAQIETEPGLFVYALRKVASNTFYPLAA